jgi:para-aminobenzoate synthetase/4-amino-4-deoxychorismate lyase
VISPQRVSSRDPLLRHKTTARNLYDRELDRAVKGGHFDAVFFNEQGELAEGARSNLFVDIGEASLLTPPLGSGVLNGVYRRKLIAAGRAREARLTLDDLRNARAIYAANAARGLVRVRLAEPAT